MLFTTYSESVLRLANENKYIYLFRCYNSCGHSRRYNLRPVRTRTVRPSFHDGWHALSRLHNPDSIKRAKLTRLKKDAGLDDQQVHAVTPIIDSYVAAVQSVKNDASLDSRTRRLKLSELRKRYDSDVDALLTPEQQQKLASIKAERRARLRGARTTSETSQTSAAPGASTVSAVVQ